MGDAVIEGTDQTGAQVPLSADFIGDRNYPHTKIRWGAAGSAVDVSATNPLPTSVETVNGQIRDLNRNALTVKTAMVNVATGQTDAQVIAAVTGKKLRVLRLIAMDGNLATSLTYNSKGAGAGTAISPTFQNDAYAGELLPGDGSLYWFQTNTGEALTVTTSAGGSTTGILVTYVEV